MARHVKREAPMTAKLLAKMKAFVAAFYRSRGEKKVVERDANVLDASAAPVLKPRTNFRYQFQA